MSKKPTYEELEQRVQELERTESENKPIKEALHHKIMFLEAQLKSSIDGILVVDAQGKKIFQNRKNIELWKIPQHIADSSEDKIQVQYVMQMTKNPEQFIENITYLYKHPDQISRDEIELTDGTVLDRYSSPVIGKDGQNIGRIWTFRDITDQKKAVEELNRIFELSPDLIGVGNLTEGYYKRVNSAYKIFGRPLDEFLSRPYIEFIHPDDHNVTASIVKTMQSGQSISGFENRYRCKDGSYRTIEWRATETQSDGTAYVAGRDITERKQAEEALRESEASYRSLFENANLAFSRSSLDGKIMAANPEFIRMFGYESLDDLNTTVKNANELFADPQRRAEIVRLWEENPVLNRFENAYLRKDGIKFIGKLTTKAIMASDDRLKFFEGFIEDITERKQAEEVLRESEQKYRQLFATVSDAIMVFDAEKKQFVDVNVAALHLYGYCKEEFLKLKLPSITAEPEKTATSLNQVLSGEIKGVPLRYHKKRDGTIFPVEISTGSFKSGNRKMLCGVIRDITERKKIEKELLNARKMESIGNLAGGIAHDFNNILSSIIGFTELALDDVEKGSNLEDNLQEVYTAGKRARDLVKQILAFARQSDEERKPIQVDTIAKEMLKLIRSTIPTTIEIKENIKSDSLVMGNTSQVHQLFMNLCTNAAHAMEDAGGILEVGLTDVKYTDQSSTLLGLKTGNYAKIKVSDTGAGISPDIIDSIFEPYFTTKGVGEGTGMGLAMVHGIVETYGGEITVDSELGQGTTFSIYLPVTQKRKPYGQYEKDTLPSGTEHILLVDDELPIAKMGSQILERLGYRVTIRTSSFEALELFRSKPDEFDLVITDMTMPNMTGDELAMEMIARRFDIPVILCTGYSKKITAEKAAKIGIKAFAYKPVVKADLAKTVRKVLDEAKG